MADDHYKVLGISRNATQDEIERAHKKLARKYHPDLNQDDPAAKAKFQQVQQAYDVLSDSEKRELYDQFGDDFENVQRPGSHGNPFAGGTGQQFEFDLGDLFGGGGGSPFGGGMGGMFEQFARAQTQDPRQGRAAARGADIRHEIDISFQTAVLGGETRLGVQQPDGTTKTITAKIPPGIDSGKSIRLRGQGQSSPMGGPRGDILITVRVQPHSHFRRRGNNLEVDLPITIREAILGAAVEVPTPRRAVTLKIPPRSSSGKRLRLKGQGVQPTKGDAGDLFVVLQIVVPDAIDDATQKLAESISEDGLDPRQHLAW